jgi:anti-sigma regulatory factor (Ser/Thr protein kinase)
MSGLSLELQASVTAAREARRALRSWLRRRRGGPAVGETAELLVSELVTNAVRHTSSPAVSVSAAVVDHQLRVVVGDSQVDQPRRPAQLPDSASPGGRGLWILDALSSGWGSQPTAAGKDVWFVLPCA